MFFFTKLTHNEYIGPYFLSHVVLRFSPSDLPGVLSPKSLEVNVCNLNCWEHGHWHIPLHTKSQVWHGCLHGNTSWRWGLWLTLRVVLREKLDPTLVTSIANILALINPNPSFNDNWPFLKLFLKALNLGHCHHVGTWDLRPHVNRPSWWIFFLLIHWKSTQHDLESLGI
jgi:hypothetical protein